MNKPNILLLVLDAVRPDHTTPYGHQRETTPNIEVLTDEGVVFENAFANSNWTLTSHGALFTGKLPTHTGVCRASRTLPHDLKTLSERIKDEGYRTFSTSAGAHLKGDRGFSRGFDVYKETYRIQLDKTTVTKVASDSSFRKQTVFSLTRGPGKKTLYKFDSLKRWISNGSDQPFFAFINCKTAHNPYNPPRPFKSMFCEELSRPRYEFLEQLYSRLRRQPQQVDNVDYERLEKMSTTFPLIGDEFEPTEREWDIIKSWYDGSIRYLDYRVGEFLEFLESIGELDDTLVVITSDHGELFGEHGLEKHNYSLYEPLLKVPLIVKPAGTNTGREGRRIESKVSLMDLFPTLIEAAGGTPPEREFAESLYDLKERERHEYLFAELDSTRETAPKRRYPDLDDSELGKPLQAVRDEQYKLISTTDGNVELYDWRNDPTESNDLSEKMNDKVSELESVLRESTGELPGHREGNDSVTDKKLKKQLKN